MKQVSHSKILDGTSTAQVVLAEVQLEVAQLKAQGCQPCLAVILVGTDPASQVYVRNKVQKAEQVGIRSLEFRMDAATSTEILLRKIKELNEDAAVHGILVQLPLPQHIDEETVLQSVLAVKDVDGFHSENVGGLSQGREVLVPCTAKGCLRLLKEHIGALSGLHAVVIGRSNIVGKPMANLLLHENCTVTIVHSRTNNIHAICKQADILVAAIGRPQLITRDFIKPDAVVIDVGINRIEDNDKTRLVGDVNFDDVYESVSAITPVPGGVGPMTIAYLMKNTLHAAYLQLQL